MLMNSVWPDLVDNGQRFVADESLQVLQFVRTTGGFDLLVSNSWPLVWGRF